MTSHPITRVEYESKAVGGVVALVCAGWVAVALVHPTAFTGADNRTWLVVHVAQLAFAPIVAVGILQLLRAMEGAGAVVGRAAVVAWAAWFAAYDAMAGIATGVLARGDAVEPARYLFDHGLVTALGWIAPAMWVLASLGTAVALRRSGARRVTQVAMASSVLVFLHAGLPAAVGFGTLAVAMWTGLAAGISRERQPAH